MSVPFNITKAALWRSIPALAEYIWSQFQMSPPSCRWRKHPLNAIRETNTHTGNLFSGSPLQQKPRRGNRMPRKVQTAPPLSGMSSNLGKDTNVSHSMRISCNSSASGSSFQSEYLSQNHRLYLDISYRYINSCIFIPFKTTLTFFTLFPASADKLRQKYIYIYIGNAPTNLYTTSHPNQQPPRFTSP